MDRCGDCRIFRTLGWCPIKDICKGRALTQTPIKINPGWQACRLMVRL